MNSEIKSVRERNGIFIDFVRAVLITNSGKKAGIIKHSVMNIVGRNTFFFVLAN